MKTKPRSAQLILRGYTVVAQASTVKQQRSGHGRLQPSWSSSGNMETRLFFNYRGSMSPPSVEFLYYIAPQQLLSLNTTLQNSTSSTLEDTTQKFKKAQTKKFFLTFLLLKLPSGTIYTKRINVFAHTGGQTEHSHQVEQKKNGPLDDLQS